MWYRYLTDSNHRQRSFKGNFANAINLEVDHIRVKWAFAMALREGCLTRQLFCDIVIAIQNCLEV